MRVKVKHYFSLALLGGANENHIELDDGSSVDDLLPLLGLKHEEVGIVIVNGKEGVWGQKLEEDDVITLIPHIGGG